MVWIAGYRLTFWKTSSTTGDGSGVGNERCSAILPHFEGSGFSSADYYQCTVMLTESSQIVRQDLERYGYSDYALYSPFCLTLDGVQRLRDLQHPVREWLKRNWFATVVAITTSLAAVTAAAFNVALQIIG